MMRGANLLAAATALFAVAACTQGAEVAVRPATTGLAVANRPVNERIAEARGQFALGNVALALEGFRKALRSDESSVDALNGIAACYDNMGRFDLSRRYYETALALAPNDLRLYANLAVSLQMQGRTDEASRLRVELAERKAALRVAAQRTAENVAPPAPAPVEAPRVVAQAMGEAAPTVVVTLAPAEAPLPVEARPAAAPAPHLERLSLAEVALVTVSAPRWKPLPTAAAVITASAIPPRPASVAAVRPVSILVLNAARSEGLAARARTMLRQTGVSRVVIGDAARVSRTSVIAYPASRRPEALQVARRLGVSLRHRERTDQRMIVVLGSDAATALRMRRG